MNSMLTLEEVKGYLEADQEQIEKLIQEGKLRAYKIGGTYLRFRKEEILHLGSEFRPKKANPQTPVPLGARIRDFWRFNNFYIIAILIVAALVLLVART